MAGPATPRRRPAARTARQFAVAAVWDVGRLPATPTPRRNPVRPVSGSERRALTQASAMSDFDEDWTDADGVVRRVKCSRCGEVRPCRWLVDPFIREVYPEDPVEPAEWCWSCYSDRYDEV